MIPLRHAAEVFVSNIDKRSVDGEHSVRLVNYTDVYYQETITPTLELMPATATREQIDKFRLHVGDSIITKDSESADDIAVSSYVSAATGDMVCGYHLAIIRPRGEIHPRYLAWALRSDPVRQHLAVAANGMTRYGLTYDAIESVALPNGPHDEQRRIADFLDDQVARIDNMIAARQRQLVLLDAERASGVHAQVTGRAPVQRRPSRLAWAETLPGTWGSVRLCQVAQVGTGHTPSRSRQGYWTACDIPWLTTGDVHRFRRDEIDSIDDTVLHISEEGLRNSSAVLHPGGTVALSRTASAGFSILMSRSMATSQDYATWTCGPLLNNAYLLWCLRVMRADLMGRLAVGSTHKTIYFPDLMSIRIPLPSIDEQAEMVRAIDSFVSASRMAGTRIAQSMTLLGELKPSLITAAVTGEFDVSTADGSRVPA